MSFECMSGTPKSCSKKFNTSSDCYDTDSSDKLASVYVLVEHCHMLMTIKVLLAIISAIAGSGVIGFTISFYYLVIKKKSEQKKKYQKIFSDIIEKELQDGKPDNQVVRNVINKLNSRISTDAASDQFKLNAKDCRNITQTAID